MHFKVLQILSTQFNLRLHPYPCLPWSFSLSLFLQVLPVRSQFTSSSVNPSWSFLSSVAPTHNNKSSCNSYNNNNNINNTRLHFLRFHCVLGPVWSTLHALFHLILIKIQLDRDFCDHFHFTEVETEYQRGNNWLKATELTSGRLRIWTQTHRSPKPLPHALHAACLKNSYST